MNKNMLSQRLKTVSDYLPKGANFADIGSDHAYLPCQVCSMDLEAKAIAGEINQGPFVSAQKTVNQYNLQDRIDVRKGNGLEVIRPHEVNQIVIAGMGGSLIASILESGKNKLDGVKMLILQPNVEARAVRSWLNRNGYRLAMEEIIEESGHVYEVLIAEKSIAPYKMTEKELLFGPWLLKENSLPFRKKWSRELKKTNIVLKEMQKAKYMDKSKAAEFEKEKKWMKEVLEND